MPCMTYSPEEESAQKSSEIVRLSQQLCEACSLIEKLGAEGKMSKDLAKWWEAHKKEDERRIKKEREDQKRRATMLKAMAKLTEEEKEALGLFEEGSDEE